MEIPLEELDYEPFVPINLEEDFDKSGPALSEQQTGRARQANVGKWRPLTREEQLDKLEKLRHAVSKGTSDPQAAVEEKLKHVAQDNEWDDPGKDRQVVEHPRRWRPKETAYSRDGDQVGETLELGEFADVQTLTVSEAALVLNAIRDRREQRGNTMVYTNGDAQQAIVDHGLKYARVFANYKQKEKVEAVDRLLSRYPELAMFERAQLGSLGRQSPEEAKTLIPSLNSKIDDETLRSLLDLLEDLWED